MIEQCLSNKDESAIVAKKPKFYELNKAYRSIQMENYKIQKNLINYCIVHIYGKMITDQILQELLLL